MGCHLSAEENAPNVAARPPGQPAQPWYLRFILWHPRIILGAITTVFCSLLAVVIALAILYARTRGCHEWMFTLTTPQFSDMQPVSDSYLGAAQIVLGTFFHPLPDGPILKVVYSATGGKLCILSKRGSAWMNTVQCVEGAHAKSGTPLTFLDWIGGPSIYFLTPDNYISGIDHRQTNDTWKLSSVIKQRLQAHPDSQISSVTWVNDTSSWIYFQDPSQQVREFGMDDYRDTAWREGSAGPLGKAIPGTGLGTVRWTNGSDEVEEIYFQQANRAIHGRMYRDTVWQPDIYTIDGTERIVLQGAGISASIVERANSSSVLLAYVSDSGFITVQTRGTTNTANFGAFSTPNKLVQGNGQKTKLAAVNSLGLWTVIFDAETKITELSSDAELLSGNATSTVPAASWTPKAIP